MAIFSLLTTFSGAFAWFLAKKEQNNAVNDFKVYSVDGKLKNIYFHKMSSKTIDPGTLEADTFTFNSDYAGKISYDWNTNTPSYTGDTSVLLEQYSPLNPEHPLLMVFELNNTYTSSYDGNITISAFTEVEGFLGSRDSNAIPVYNLKTTGVYYSEPNPVDSSKTDYYYALSSVVDFMCSDSNSELYNKTGDVNTTLKNPTYTVSSMRNRDMSIAAKEADPEAVVPDLSFTSVNNSNDTTSFKQKPYIYTSQSGSSVKYISIIVDYYRDAVEYIYSTYLGNETLENDFKYILNYLCDWGLEVL